MTEEYVWQMNLNSVTSTLKGKMNIPQTRHLNQKLLLFSVLSPQKNDLHPEGIIEFSFHSRQIKLFYNIQEEAVTFNISFRHIAILFPRAF